MQLVKFAHTYTYRGAPALDVVLLYNNEIHITPLVRPFHAPLAAMKDFLKLKKKFTKLYTKHPVVDRTTPTFNKRLGLKEVKRDFAFVYYET